MLGDLGLFVLLVFSPGWLLVVQFHSLRDRDVVTQSALGGAVGLVLVPILFVALRSIGLHEFTGAAIGVLDAILFASLWLRKLDLAAGKEADWRLPAIGVLTMLIVMAFSFTNFHPDDGGYAMKGLFAVDIPFLAGVLPSIERTGYYQDMHQSGLQVPYHDFVYFAIATVGQLSDSTYVEILAFAFPIFAVALVLLSAFALARSIVGDDRVALAAAAGWYLIGSFWNSPTGTNLLSPSYAAGAIILLNVLRLLLQYWRGEVVHPKLIIITMCVLLFGLAHTKIPMVILLQAALMITLLLALLRKKNHLLLPLSILCILGIGLLVFSGSDPSVLQPTGEFLLGAPLLGYANHVSRVLGMPLEQINPVVKDLHFGINHFSIIPFSIFHVIRFALLDPRQLLLISMLLLGWKEIHYANLRSYLLWLILPLALLGPLLPVLYSPSWYPMALSFYTIELSSQIAGLVGVALLGVALMRSHRVAVSIGISLLVVGVIAGAYWSLRSSGAAAHNLDATSKRTLDWLRQHVPTEERIASHRYDLDLTDTLNDESFYLYSAFSERTVVSAGAKYGSLLGAVADVDSVKGLRRVPAAVKVLSEKRSQLGWLFNSPNPSVALLAANRLGVRYLLEDHARPPRADAAFRTLAKPVFGTSSLTVWLLEDSLIARAAESSRESPL